MKTYQVWVSGFTAAGAVFCALVHAGFLMSLLAFLAITNYWLGTKES